MVGWDACTQEPNKILRWMECHPALGGYLTLVAILATIWATFYIGRQERKRTAARGRVIAFRLSPVIDSIHADVTRALLCVAELETGTNNFHMASRLVANLALPSKIPDDIFCDTWVMRPEIALFIAKLENEIKNYTTVTGHAALSSINMIPQDDRTEVLQNLRNMLEKIDLLCLIVAKHCTRVSEVAIVPWQKRWQRSIKKLIG